MDAEDFTPVHLSCEFLSFSFPPYSLDTNGIIFSTVTETGEELSF